MANQIQSLEMSLSKIERAYKEIYLPAWKNMLGVNPSAMLTKIKKKPLEGQKIVATAPRGLSGGFGFGSELGDAPAAGNVMYERFETEPKDMYVHIALSIKALRLTSSGASMVNALNTEVKAAYETAKWNVGRSLFGNGTGILTTTEALGTAGNLIKVADTRFVKEGLIIDIYATGGTVPVQPERRILMVDKVNKTVRIDGTPVTLAAGFITIQNSLNRELTGLGAIYDENITKIYGVDRTANTYLNPLVTDAENTIDDSIITGILRDAENDKNSAVDMLLCGGQAYDAYVNYLRVNNQRIEEPSRKLDGGFKGVRFIFGNREVEVFYEQFVPSNEMWGIDSTAMELHMQEWEFMPLQGTSIFTLMHDKTAYRALMSNFGDLVCTNPGGCVRIKNVA